MKKLVKKNPALWAEQKMRSQRKLSQPEPTNTSRPPSSPFKHVTGLVSFKKLHPFNVHLHLVFMPLRSLYYMLDVLVYAPPSGPAAAEAASSVYHFASNVGQITNPIAITIIREWPKCKWIYSCFYDDALSPVLSSPFSLSIRYHKSA